MKTPLFNPVLRHGLLLLSLAALLCGLSAGATTPQYMTYQGYLTDQNGVPLGTNGPQNYSVVFRLWNQPTGGATPLYGELQVVTVANGYFSVLLGQGTTYQNGGATDPQPPLSTVFTNPGSVYVEMTVKGLASGADVTILPRLQLVSAPYAFLAANASALVNATSGANVITSSGNNVSVSGAVTATSFTGNGSGLTSLNAADLTGQVPAAALSIVAMLAGGNAFTGNQTVMSGNVGIGTATPGATLSIQQSIQRSEALRLAGLEYFTGEYSDTAGISFLVGVNRSNNRQLWIADSTQVASPNSSNSVIRIMPNGSRIDSIGTDGNTPQPLHLGTGAALTLFTNGYVGIGTTTPQSQLQVNGNIQLGPNGQYQAVAAASEETKPLRIVRGNVDQNGNILYGAGFTVTHNGTGDYTVSFNTAFSDTPTFTANAVDSSADAVTIEGISPLNVQFHIGVKNVGWFDEPFNFIVIGPR